MLDSKQFFGIGHESCHHDDVLDVITSSVPVNYIPAGCHSVPSNGPGAVMEVTTRSDRDRHCDRASGLGTSDLWKCQWHHVTTRSTVERFEKPIGH